MERKVNFLTEDFMRRAAPAIFAERAHSRVSNRYEFIPTREIIMALDTEGWKPTSVMQSRASGERYGFQRHMVRFQHVDGFKNMVAVGDTIPELVLVNSHDLSTTFSFMAGMLRLACLNGMIVNAGTHDQISTRHINIKKEVILEAAYEVIKELPQIAEFTNKMKQVNLEVEQQHVLAQGALVLRYGEGWRYASIRPNQLLIPRRPDEAVMPSAPQSLWQCKRDAWNTFNVIQENVIRGGIAGRSISTSRRIHTRPVTSVKEDVRLNRGLWSMAAEAAGLKKAA